MRAVTSVAIFLMMLSSGCVSAVEEEPQEIVVVAGKAFDMAKSSSVDLEKYSLQSVRLLRNGRMTAANDLAKDPYTSSVRDELKGKKYWEACYLITSDMALGATYCYYFESGSMNYLSKYTVK